MELIPFEIIYVLPPTFVPSLLDELILPLKEVDLLESLKSLSQIQADILPQLRTQPPFPLSPTVLCLVTGS